MWRHKTRQESGQECEREEAATSRTYWCFDKYKTNKKMYFSVPERGIEAWNCIETANIEIERHMSLIVHIIRKIMR